MKKNIAQKASALIVAVGLLAVLSAMAFTFVTVMRVEIDASVANRIGTQTGMLDQWALQRVVDRLARDPYEGAMFTPVDWAGEEWYSRPLITQFTGMNGSRHTPALPLGNVMSFSSQEMSGKGVFAIDARVIDTASQISLVDGNLEDSDLRETWIKWKKRMLTGMPFAIDYERKASDKQFEIFPVPRYKCTYYLKPDQAEAIAREVYTNMSTTSGTDGQIRNKDQLLKLLLNRREDFRSFDMEAPIDKDREPRISDELLSDFYNGRKDEAGNPLTIGFKDFITLDSWIDEGTQLCSDTEWIPWRRAPININTASSWTIRNILFGLKSKEGGDIRKEDAEALADYIVAFRTPAAYLTIELRKKQMQLAKFIRKCEEMAPPDGAVVPDPVTGDELKGHVVRLAHLLINPEYADRNEDNEILKQFDEADIKAKEDWPKDREVIRLYPQSKEGIEFNKRIYTELPRPFASWSEFDGFLKVIVYAASTSESGLENISSFALPAGRTKARLIMANANPNTNFSLQAPRNSFGMWNCGKDNVVADTTTTEFCFGSFGKFEMDLNVSKSSVVITRNADKIDEPENKEITIDRQKADSFQTKGLIKQVDFASLSNLCILNDPPPIDFDDGKNEYGPFNVFRHIAILDTPLRTIRKSGASPDRLCFYNLNGELIGAWSIYDSAPGGATAGKKWGELYLDRPLSPVFSAVHDPNPLSRWERAQLLTGIDLVDKQDDKIRKLDPPPQGHEDRKHICIGCARYPRVHVGSWAIERLESMKKWSAVVSFAEAVRLSTQENLVEGLENKWNTPEGKVLFLPNQRFKQSPKGIMGSDGSIMLMTSTPDDDAQGLNTTGTSTIASDFSYKQPFDFTDEINLEPGDRGIGSTNNIYNEGCVTPFGYKIGPKSEGNTLKYPISTVFPPELTKKFCVGMWLCFTERPTTTKVMPILTYTSPPASSLQSTIKFQVAADGALELLLSATKKGSVPKTLKVEGGASVLGWRVGEWHYVGFSFSETETDKASHATIFATVLTENGEKMDQTVDAMKAATLVGPNEKPLHLYGDIGANDPPRVAFGGEGISAIIDNIQVLGGKYVNVATAKESFKNVRRFKATPCIYAMDDRSFGNLLHSKTGTSQDIELGTMAWTEQMPGKYLPQGKFNSKLEKDPEYGRWADVRVTVNKHMGGADRTLRGDKKDEPPNAAWQRSIWFPHDYLVAGGNFLARIGLRGEGQRIAEGLINNEKKTTKLSDYVYARGDYLELPSYTGHFKDIDREQVAGSCMNDSSNTSSALQVAVKLIGPSGQWGKENADDTSDAEDTNMNFDSPCVDDVTITYFPPLNVRYWKQATTISE